MSDDFDLYRHAGRWVVDASPHILSLMNRMFVKSATAPIKGKHARKPLSLSMSPDNCKDLLWFMLRYPANISESDLSFMREQASVVDRIVERLRAYEKGDLVAPILDMEKPPYKYQLDAISMFEVSRRMLLGDELGLGKTVTAIGCTLLEGGLPACIVVPTHLRQQWVDKLREFLFLPNVVVINKTVGIDLPAGTEYFVTSYNLLQWWVPALVRFGVKTLVMDEVHSLRANDTEKRRSAVILSEHAERVLGLSGTPIYNYGLEMHSVMDAIAPGMLGSSAEFGLEWCKGGKTVENPVELGKYLRSRGMMLRRTNADVGRKAGDVVTDVVHIEASLEELSRIEKIATLLAKQALTGYGTSSGQSARELDARLRHATGMAKAGAAAHFLKDLLASEQRILVGTWHHDVKNAITSELVKAGIAVMHYTGEQTAANKSIAIDSFKKAQGKAVLIMNIRSGEGVEGLQEVCSTIVTVELDWSPAAHKQFVGRLDRPGQKLPVKHFILAVDDGSDPPVMQTLGIKKSQRDGIVDLKTTAFEAPPEARLKEMAAAYLARRQDFSFSTAEGKAVKPASPAGLELASYLDAVVLPIEAEKLMRATMDPIVSAWAEGKKYTVEFEKVLSPDNRVDVLVTAGHRTIGVECKVQGDRTDVYRQLMRYSAFVDELILVCPWPLANFSVDGVPVHVVTKYPEGVV